MLQVILWRTCSHTLVIAAVLIGRTDIPTDGHGRAQSKKWALSLSGEVSPEANGALHEWCSKHCSGKLGVYEGFWFELTLLEWSSLSVTLTVLWLSFQGLCAGWPGSLWFSGPSPVGGYWNTVHRRACRSAGLHALCCPALHTGSSRSWTVRWTETCWRPKGQCDGLKVCIVFSSLLWSQLSLKALTVSFFVFLFSLSQRRLLGSCTPNRLFSCNIFKLLTLF